MSKQYFEHSFTLLLRGLWLLRKSAIRNASGKLVRAYWNNYIRVQYNNNAELHDVSLPIDARIPFNAKAVWVYGRFVGTFIGLLGYLYILKHESLSDLEQFILDIEQLYQDGGLVFRSTQTTFKRSGCSMAITVLRALDQEKNAAPSLHVAFAVFIYFRGTQLLKQYNKDDVKRSEQVLLKFAARVVDSTLFIKQHCVRDVALGLVLITNRHPEFASFASRVIENIFVHSVVVVPDEVKNEARSLIQDIYNRLTGSREVLTEMIHYLSDLPLKK